MVPPSHTTNWLLRSAALVVILAGLKLATPLVVPLLLASFLAIVSAPLMFWLIHHGINRYAAVVAALSANFAFFAAMAGLVVSGLNALVSALPRYAEQVDRLRDDLGLFLAQQGIPRAAQSLPRTLRYEDMSTVVADLVAQLARTVSSLMLVLFLVAFVLVEMLGIEGKLRHVFRHPEIGIEQFRRASAHVQRYIVVKTGANLLTGVLVWVWLAAFRVDFALLWGVCAFMLNYVPTLGSLILGVPVALVTLLQYGFGTTVLVGAGYVLINTAIAGLIEPRAFGQALGLSPLVVFLSMVCWGWLFGPVGAVLSVPLTVVGKIVFAYVDGYEWLSEMLGPSTGASGVGAPSIPPGVLASFPPSVGAGIALGSHSQSFSGLSPMGVSGVGQSSSISSTNMAPVSPVGMAPIVPGTPSFAASSSSIPPPMDPEDEGRGE